MRSVAGQLSHKDVVILSGLHGAKNGENYHFENSKIVPIKCDESFFKKDKADHKEYDRINVVNMDGLSYDQFCKLYSSEYQHMVLAWCFSDIDRMFREITSKRGAHFEERIVYLSKIPRFCEWRKLEIAG